MQIKRDVDYSNLVTQTSKGICEYDSKLAPFETEEDKPFLEVYQTVRLVDGSADTPENRVDVHQNYQRILHFFERSRIKVT